MASSDLVRNLVMSMLSAEPQRQVTVYKESWLPLEQLVLAARNRSTDAATAAAITGAGVCDGAADDVDDGDDADEFESGKRLDEFFIRFLRVKWGVTDLRKVNGVVVLHDDLDVAFPAFAAEFRSRLVRWAGEHRGSGTGAQRGAAPTAAGADEDVKIAVDKMGGGVAPTLLEPFMPAYAEAVIAELLEFARSL